MGSDYTDFGKPSEPDTCVECEELAVGYDDDGTPLCAAHYRGSIKLQGQTAIETESSLRSQIASLLPQEKSDEP